MKMRVTIYSTDDTDRKLLVKSALMKGEVSLTITDEKDIERTIRIRAGHLRQALVALGQ